MTFFIAKERRLEDASRKGETVVKTITSHPDMPMCHSGKSTGVNWEQGKEGCALTPDTNAERRENGPKDELSPSQ